MANPTPDQQRRATQITDEIATLGFALPGSVALRYTTCGTAGCRCHADPPRPHGPYLSWTRKVAAKTITRRLSAEEYAHYQPWFQAHRRRRDPPLQRARHRRAVAAWRCDWTWTGGSRKDYPRRAR